MIEKKPSCIVLGGGGFIGTNLCRRLVDEGHRVRAFGRNCPFPEALEGVEWFQGDFGDAAALAAAIETFDVIYHLVNGATPLSANLDMAGDVQRNIVASLWLLEICRKLGVSRVVFISSGGTIYGCPQQIPTPETAPTDPITAYGINKLAIEKYLALYRHLHQIDYRILRVTNPFGPFQTSIKNQGVIASMIARALRDEAIEIWGDGSVVRDFIFVDDVVDALVAAAHDRSDTRIFNIGSGEGHSLRQVLASIEVLLGKKPNVQWKPGRPLDVPISVLAIDRAREVLGWAPKTSFEDGLRSTLAWWQNSQ
ncbi:NAD-dependent epimerase/dehydratase family protein [uncultured Bradyrhizobium sp.]|uniref:NAD-dependent epimerase/dehydratase family protein n=1 Tax=uncultured Bradyrhizobium sp. TaxID=199684 RepID=UPI0035C9D2F8